MQKLNNWKKVVGLLVMVVMFVCLVISYKMYTGKMQYVVILLTTFGVTYAYDANNKRKNRIKQEVNSGRTYDMGRTCFQPVMKYGIKDFQ